MRPDERCVAAYVQGGVASVAMPTDEGGGRPAEFAGSGGMVRAQNGLQRRVMGRGLQRGRTSPLLFRRGLERTGWKEGNADEIRKTEAGGGCMRLLVTAESTHLSSLFLSPP